MAKRRVQVCHLRGNPKPGDEDVLLDGEDRAACGAITPILVRPEYVTCPRCLRTKLYAQACKEAL